MHPVTDIVIIGGGASATLLAAQLTRHGIGPRCVIIDPADSPAVGLAYATPCLEHRLNVRASNMSAFAGAPDHFLAWLRTHIDPDTSPDAFVPRALYGVYLRGLLDTTRVRAIRDVAIDCQRRADGLLHITLATGRTLSARQVVLAFGHFDPAPVPGVESLAQRQGGYCPTAWTTAAYAPLHAGDEVILIGTGLTAVDAVLRLRAVGFPGRITAVSRHGWLPERHAPCASLPPPVVSPGDTPPTVRAYLRAFRAAMAAGVAWRTAVDSLRPVTNALWNALPDVERRRFRRCLQRRWDILRHRMAPEVADRIDADRAAGSLRILDGHVTEVMTTPDGMAVHLRTRGGARTLTGARVVNCTGASLAYRHVASPLLAAMFRSGQIASGFADQGLDCTDAGQVRDAGGVPVPGLFALGPPRLGVLFESIAIPEIRQQAAALADYLAAYPAAGKHAADTAD